MTSPKYSQFLQRPVATAPILLQPPPRGPAYNTREEADTIFSHANAKVVSLVAVSKQTFNLSSPSQDAVGPWQSYFERTIAIGAFRLYRAPGSVVFLSCGTALQPIFPKSQCWCMEDGGSKFILQIKPPSYWRIELTASYAPDEESSNTLRSCLSSVLLLDKTPCPFKESVPISLRPEPLSVGKRRSWKPLRSYPSEPTLAREAEEVFDVDLQNLRNNAWIEALPVEHPVEKKPVLEETLNRHQFHEDASNSRTEFANLQDSKDTSLRPLLEGQKSSVPCHLQDASHVDGYRQLQMYNMIHGTRELVDNRLLEPSQKAEMVHVPPLEQHLDICGPGQSQTIASGIASGWLDTETDAVLQQPIILQEHPATWKPTKDLAEMQVETRTTTNHCKQLTTTSVMKDDHHHAQPGDEPELRLRREHFGAGISKPDNELQSSGATPDTETELLRTDIIFKAILLLMYAICGIGVVVSKTVIRVVNGVSRRRPSR